MTGDHDSESSKIIKEFNSREEAFAFVRTNRDKLPKFAHYEIEVSYGSKKELVEDKPRKVRLIIYE